MRCFGDGTPLYEQYHDQEWGRPQLTERQLYEKICLEGLQSGLAWITVLRKREALREVLHGFDPDLVAGLAVEPLLADARLIRSLPKLRACVANARATVDLRAHGGLPDLIMPHATHLPAPMSGSDVPASTPASTQLAKQLKSCGFSFVGPTTVYSLLQACGLVGDHLLGCDARARAEAERAATFHW